MLLSEIVYNIKNLIAGGVESDDENLADAQVAFMVSYYRAKLFRQDQAKGRVNKQAFTQNLGKVKLIQADKNECCDIDVCTLRTETKIPIPLETFDELNLTFVGTIEGRPYDKKYHNVMYWNKAAKYTGKEPKWYYQNGYLYIINAPDVLEYINIQGVFENPVFANEFKTCSCESGCEGLDFEYSMPLHYVDLIVKLVVETEIKVLTALPSDVNNDGLDQVRNAS